MILRELNEYLQLHRRATLGDIALHFDVHPDAARGMLDLWIRKGRVRQLDAQATCNMSCPVSCDDSAMLIYESVDFGAAVAPRRPLNLLPMVQSTASTCRQSARAASPAVASNQR